MKHLDDGRLQSWLDQDRSGITEAEVVEIEDHVASCQLCATRLAELEGSSDRARSLLAIAAPRRDITPDFDDVVRRSRRGGLSGRGARGWMAAGWAASLVAAVGLGWMSNALLRPGFTARDPGPAEQAEGMVAAREIPQGGEERGRAPATEAAEAEVPVVAVAPAREPEPLSTAREPAAPVRSRAEAPAPATGIPQLRVVSAPAAADVTEAISAADTVSVDFRLEQMTLALPETPVASLRRTLRFADTPREFWAPATRARAESSAAFALLTVPDLPILEIELGEMEGAVAVRVRQGLEAGGVLTLVQRRTAGPEVSPTLPEGQPVMTVRRGDLVVTGSAPIPVDSLRALLDALKP